MAKWGLVEVNKNLYLERSNGNLGHKNLQDNKHLGLKVIESNVQSLIFFFNLCKHYQIK